MPVDASEVFKLAADLQTARGRTGRASAAVVRKVAADVEAQAKRLAPVGKTGNLRESIDTRFYGTGNSASMSAVVRPNVPYAHLVEHGTSRQQPQPFMLPALRSNEAKFLAGMSALAAKVLDL